MTRWLGRLALMLAVALSACSTHEERFEADVPPPRAEVPVDRAAMLEATSAIALRYSDELPTLSVDALAPLTEATSIAFDASGAPAMRALVRRYADAMLDARVPIAGGVGFFGADDPGAADARATATAASALASAFAATRDPRYGDAAREATRALTSTALGWRVASGGAGLRTSSGRGVDIAATARALKALHIASRPPLAAATTKPAQDAFRLLESAQAGLGRWYAHTESRTPMTLGQWATTLAALAALSTSPAEGILGGGTPALWKSAFTADGALAAPGVPDPDATGAAVALDAFQSFEGSAGWAELAIADAAASRREDGTVTRAPSVDAPVQALYAVAFARRALALREAEG